MCTIFSAADKDIALGGNNEDFVDPYTCLWYVSPEGGMVGEREFAGGQYGRVYFGYKRDPLFMQGGMNEKGLFFDYTACPYLEITRTVGKPVFEGDLMDPAMAECATVEEALAYLDQYHWTAMERACLILSDASGASAILEGDEILYKQGRYQVLTNFYQSKTTAKEIGCTRFQIATEMLQAEAEISVDLFRRVLSAVRQEGRAQTVYSNIYDLKRQLVYLYHFHDFEHVIEIDLEAELEKGSRALYIPDLFPKKHYSEEYLREADFGLRRAEHLNELRDCGVIQDVSLDPMERYLGRYKAELSEEVLIELIRAEKRVFCVMTATGGREYRPTHELYPASESSFVAVRAGGNHSYTFEKDDEGKIAQLTIDVGRGYQIMAQRID